MIKKTELVVEPAKISDKEFIKKLASEKLHVNENEITAVVQDRRSLDARSRRPVYRISSVVYLNEVPEEVYPRINYEPVKGKKQVIIVGFGPAGMFAALRLIELGIKPVILERGKDVQSRRRDLRAIQQFSIVDPDSNYCFGEGGAGTYSDGKLYTRSNKRGDIKKILGLLVQHGADESIMIEAHPHIGSNKLPRIVQAIRETVINCGGEVHFNSKVTDFILRENKISGVVVNGELEVMGDAVILATGHSARDIFYLLKKHDLSLEAKPFAMGVRIEHPQHIIDEIQYHAKERNPLLPAASYSLTCRVGDRGVFSFCMCPGGIIIPASTGQEELVLNGMSVSRRDSKYANSGFVVTVNEEDWVKYSAHGAFAGLMYQMEVEKMAFLAGGSTQRAPAQRITDFVKGKVSGSLPGTSYIPGVTPAALHEMLPPVISKGLKGALIESGKKMRGYFTEEAQFLAAETRTSSPIRVPRDEETFMHVSLAGLFPSGEGAGYAGGIVSAAMDGENSATAAAKYIKI
ncbi:MAG: FAD-binding protein [Ignavibacteria bacterium]|nr:FAD-binding protein [Ignavibacteria bacterium]MCU7503985.1 FAD-binding protein [Ignavibacteria bacterium]MCU7515357.1 FAD-binding protein [Ignavibacteria bacterium]